MLRFLKLHCAAFAVFAGIIFLQGLCLHIVAHAAIAKEHFSETRTLDEVHLYSKNESLVIDVRFPIFEQEKVNEDIELWVLAYVKRFSEEFEDVPRLLDVPYDLLINYTTAYPSANIVSIALEIASYTGGAHGNLEIVTMTYDLKNAALLEPLDFFQEPTMALELMSRFSYNSLSNSLGNLSREYILREGTEAALENYSALMLTPAGIRIYFQPYQVAPWSAGTQIVNVPLDFLEEAKPKLVFWGK